MKKRLGVSGSRPLADFLPTITITAKDLANQMTTIRVRERDLRSEGAITTEHVGNNREIRGALSKRGIRPEELPAAEDVRKLQGRLREDEQRLLGSTKKRKNSKRGKRL